MRVSVGLETTMKEVEALEHVFRWAEIPVIVDDEIARFSGDSPWVMYVAAPLEWFSSRFVRTVQGDGAGETWAGLRSFVEQVDDAFIASSGSVVFTDEQTEVMVALTRDLSGDAYRELLELDLLEVEGERISWEAERQSWYTFRGEPCPKK
jgi:hypothetical protein